MNRQKIMASVVIAAIVIASIIVAVAKNSEGEGFINPKAIMPGAITTEHLADDSVTNDKLAAKAVSQGKIKSGAVTYGKLDGGAVTDIKLASGAIPCEVNYTDTEVTVTGTAETEIFNKSVELKRSYRLILFYTINDSWAESGNASILNCTVFNKTGAFAASAYPDNLILYGQNFSTTITFYTDVVADSATYFKPEWLNVSITLRSNSTGTVGIKEQALTVIALPA